MLQIFTRPSQERRQVSDDREAVRSQEPNSAGIEEFDSAMWIGSLGCPISGMGGSGEGASLVYALEHRKKHQAKETPSAELVHACMTR